MQRGGVPGEVGDEHFEQLVQHVVAGALDRGLLEDQLRVGQQREQLTDREQEVDVVLLRGGRCGRREQRLETVGLLEEDRDVRQMREVLKDAAPVCEADPAQAAAGALREQEVVVGEVAAAAHVRQLLGA